VMSTWCQRLRHSFRTCPIHFHRYRHRPTSENSIRYKREVKTVPKTGSTNNLATGTDVDTISVAIFMFLRQVFQWYNICRPNPTRRFLYPEIPRWRIPEVVITLRRKTISRWFYDLNCWGNVLCLYCHWECRYLSPLLTFSTSRFRYSFYFRFTPDSVVWSRTMSMPVEVDLACSETLPQPLRSPWYRFPS